MTSKDWIDIIKEVGSLLVIAGAFIGTIYAGLTSFQKARSEAAVREAAAKAQIATSKKEAADHDVELTERLNEIAANSLKAMEDRLNRLEARLVQKEKEAEAWQNKYWQSERRAIEMGEAGLKLIEAIEAGFAARSTGTNGTTCAACISQDREMIMRLNEIKLLFRRSATGGNRSIEGSDV